MQAELCEDANEIVKAMIGNNISLFLENAIKADGRGHFLSRYDGEEIQLKGGLYAYKN